MITVTQTGATAPTALEGTAVDCHVHIFGPRSEAPTPRHPHPQEGANLKEVSALGQSFGIGRFVLTQPSFLGFDNSLLISTVAATPDRLRGVVWLEPNANPDKLADLTTKGIVGLRFPYKYLEKAPDWQSYSELLIAARNAHVHVELGLSGAKLTEAIHVMLDRGLTVVVAHLGMFNAELGPDRDPNFAALLEAATTGQVWIKLSAPYIASRNKTLRACERLLNALGPERLVWGSDWPHVGGSLDRLATYGLAMEWFRSCINDEVIRTKILTASPAELYRFDGPS